MRKVFVVFVGVLLASVLYAGKPQKQQQQRVQPTPTPASQKKVIIQNIRAREAAPETTPDNVNSTRRSWTQKGTDDARGGQVPPKPTPEKVMKGAIQGLDKEVAPTPGEKRYGGAQYAGREVADAPTPDAERHDKSSPILLKEATTPTPAVNKGVSGVIHVDLKVQSTTTPTPDTAKKATPAPKVDSINLNSSRSNIYRVRPTVTPTPGRKPGSAR